MRLFLPAVLLLTLALPVSDAAAVPDGKVAVLRNGEVDGFSRDGKLQRLNSLRAFVRYGHLKKKRSALKRCGFQRAIIENLKGPPGTDGISTTLRFKSDSGARKCARIVAPAPGKPVDGLPHSKLFLLGKGEHPGRNLRFVVGGTAYLVGFTPTADFDPGNSGLIAAAKKLYARVT